MVDDVISALQARYGPAYYRRVDTRLAKHVPKPDMVKRLVDQAPATLNGEA